VKLFSTVGFPYDQRTAQNKTEKKNQYLRHGGRGNYFSYFIIKVCCFVWITILVIVLLKKQVESIVLSIISMLSSPNDESPANIEAAVS
jgi:Ubiquitin-conjugating enzyme